MGCNTSKESVPTESENKETQEGGDNVVEDKTEIRLTDSPANSMENHVEGSTDSKPASAKTITLHSNGSAAASAAAHKKDQQSTASAAAKEEQKEQPSSSSASQQQQQEEPEEDEEEEERAATKIQAAFRGHKTRKSMKQPTGKVEPSKAATTNSSNSNSNEPTREELEAEFRLDDEELCHAATKIQASFRGHMTRKNKDEQKKNDESSTSHAKEQDPEEELDIDLTDPELNKAAVKIQASFRGHMTRKDNDDKPAEK